MHISSQRTLPLYDSTLACAAAKAALTNYSKAPANEVSPKGVRVLTVSPGFIETDAATRMIQRMADKDKSDFTAARQKLMDMLGGIPFCDPTGPRKSRSLSPSPPRTELPPSPALKSLSTAELSRQSEPAGRTLDTSLS